MCIPLYPFRPVPSPATTPSLPRTLQLAWSVTSSPTDTFPPSIFPLSLALLSISLPFLPSPPHVPHILSLSNIDSPRLATCRSPSLSSSFHRSSGPSSLFVQACPVSSARPSLLPIPSLPFSLPQRPPVLSLFLPTCTSRRMYACCAFLPSLIIFWCSSSSDRNFSRIESTCCWRSVCSVMCAVVLTSCPACRRFPFSCFFLLARKRWIIKRSRRCKHRV